MKVVKQISYFDESDEKLLGIYLLSDGEFLIHAVKEYQFEKRLGELEHPMTITKEPWVLFTVTLGVWVFRRLNANIEQIIVLKEFARMKLEEFTIITKTFKY